MTSTGAPTEVRAPLGAKVFTLVWEDGTETAYPHRLLRGMCPCAHCQGHQGPIGFHDFGDPELDEIEEVGNYALRLIWSDGHGTGIYSFAMFHRMRDLTELSAERWSEQTLPR